MINLKESHSKMKNLNYDKLEVQKYLRNSQLSVENKRDLFAYRTRMADFGENFMAGYDGVLCPLCIENFDNQSHAFQCRVIRNEIEINGDINEKYGEKITKETAKIVTEILKIRKKLLENQAVD